MLHARINGKPVQRLPCQSFLRLSNAFRHVEHYLVGIQTELRKFLVFFVHQRVKLLFVLGDLARAGDMA